MTVSTVSVAVVRCLSVGATYLVGLAALTIGAPPAMGAEPAAQPTAEQLKLLKTFRGEFVDITPGKGKFPQSFMMGDDRGPAPQRPAHRVTFRYPFAIAKYEVPQNLWEAVMGENPSRWKGPRNSVEMLTHAEAQEFCSKATQMMRATKLIEANQVIRLPSEAEWEYVARAGTDTKYSFGDDLSKLDAHAWHTGNAAGNDPPVGALKPNPWGLYDIHGYLWEWCADVAVPHYEGAPQDGSPRTSPKDRLRVIRGGSWKDMAPSLTSRARSGRFRHDDGVLVFEGGIMGDIKDDAIGLRCVLASVKEENK